MLQWLVAATSAVEEPIEFYEGGIIASDAVRSAWNALRAVLRGWGVTEREGLSISWEPHRSEGTGVHLQRSDRSGCAGSSA